MAIVKLKELEQRRIVDDDDVLDIQVGDVIVLCDKKGDISHGPFFVTPFISIRDDSYERGKYFGLYNPKSGEFVFNERASKKTTVGRLMSHFRVTGGFYPRVIPSYQVSMEVVIPKDI